MQMFFVQAIYEAMGFSAFSWVVLFHMMIRGVIIYFLGLSLARFNKKLMGVRTPFNFVLFIMLGSIFAAAIIDVRLFLPIVGTIVLLTLLNGSVTALAFYFPAVEIFVKGSPSMLVQNGKIQWQNMQKNFITHNELLNELQTRLHTRSLDDIDSAILASDGTINFTVKDRCT